MPKSRLAITRGRYGCVAYDRVGPTIEIPPLIVGGIDTMGAGDAFLAVSAPLIAVGLELEIAAFVGNVAGAIKVGILGHQRHVGRVELLAKVEELVG
jgi:sugar/nucleoside kinase (ribokinase family)